MTGSLVLSLLNPKVWATLGVAVLVSGVVGYWRGHEAGSAAVQAQWNDAKQAAAEAVAQAKDNDIAAALQASTTYQEKKSNEQVKLRVVRQVVTRTVTGECFTDDSLQHLNEAIRPLSPASTAR